MAGPTRDAAPAAVKVAQPEQSHTTEVGPTFRRTSTSGSGLAPPPPPPPRPNPITAAILRAGPAPAAQAAILTQAAGGGLGRARTASVLQLQRTFGNRHTARVVAHARAETKPKLVVGAPGDRHEQEADQVADHIAEDLEHAPPIHALTHVPRVAVVQRMLTPVRASSLEGSGSFAASDDVGSRIEAQRGQGSALPGSVRDRLEPRFGADFSSVRVHTGGEAHALNRSLESRAFTTGHDIFFRDGAYAPHSAEGTRLIAHELSHVVQQGGASGVGQLYIQRDKISEAVQRFTNLRTWIRPSVQTGFEAVMGYFTHEHLEALSAELAGLMLGDPTGYARGAQKLINALKWALGAWGQLPAPFKKALVYLTMHYLSKAGGWATRAGESLLVSEDGDAPSQAQIVKAIGWLETIARWTLKAAAVVTDEIANLPANTVRRTSRLVMRGFDYLFPGLAPPQPAAAAPAAAQAAPPQALLANDGALTAPAEPMKPLDLGVVTLMLHDLSLKKTKQDPETKKPVSGGLVIKAGVEVRLFGHSFDYGKDGTKSLEVRVPWAGSPTATLNEDLKYRGTLNAGLFEVSDLAAKQVVLGDEGLESGTFTIGELKLWKDVAVVKGAEAEVKRDGLTLKADTATVNVRGHGASATGVEITLDKKGSFVSGKVGKIGEEDAGLLYAEKAELDRNALALTKASVAIPFRGMRIKLSGVKVSGTHAEGKAETDAGDIEVIKDRVRLAEVKAQGTLKDDGWSLGASGKLMLNGDALGVKTDLKGQLAVTYKKSTKVEQDAGLAVRVKDGSLKAELGALLALDVKRIDYDSAAGELKLAVATLRIARPVGLTAIMNDVRITEAGLAFKDATVKYPGTFRPVSGLGFKQLKARIYPSGGRYAVTGGADVYIDFEQPLKVNGHVLGAELTVSEEGFHGEFDSLDVKTTLLRVKAEGGEFDGTGLAVEAGEVTLEPPEQRAKAQGGWASLAPSFDLGILSYLGRAQLGLKAKDISVKEGKGFSVGSLRPTIAIPPLELKLFKTGDRHVLRGTLDVEAGHADIEANTFEIPGALWGFWPVGFKFVYPVFPGFEVGAHVAFGGGMQFSGKASIDRLKAPSDKEPAAPMPWKLGGSFAIRGGVHAEVGVEVGIGSSLFVALTGGLYAKATAGFNAHGDIKGHVMWDGNKLKPHGDVSVDTGVDSELKASLGGRISARAFYFFEKNLYDVTFKEWTLGKLSLGNRVFTRGEGDAVDVDSSQKPLGIVGAKALKVPSAGALGKADLEEPLKPARAPEADREEVPLSDEEKRVLLFGKRHNGRAPDLQKDDGNHLLWKEETELDPLGLASVAYDWNGGGLAPRNGAAAPSALRDPVGTPMRSHNAPPPRPPALSPQARAAARAALSSRDSDR